MRIKSFNNIISNIGKVASAKFFGRIRPLSVVFFLTYRCNLNCKYCGQSHDLGNSYSESSELSVKEIERVFIALKTAKVDKINLSGGEPLIRSDLAQIISAARSQGLSISLSTNGILLPERVDLLKDLNLIVLSLDGKAQAHDFMRGDSSHKTALKAIEVSSAKNIPILLSCVISNKTTAQDIDFVLDICNHYNARCVFQPVLDRGFFRESWQICPEISKNKPKVERAREIIDYIRKHKYFGKVIGNMYWYNSICEFYKRQLDPKQKKYPCMGGRLFLAISPDGSVISCGPRAQKIFDCKAHQEGFNKSLKGKIPQINCEGCFCYSYILMNSLAKFNFETIKAYLAHKHIDFLKN
ncbi:MAG: radical SAM protein [Candidatus Omnitrophota bacterium]